MKNNLFIISGPSGAGEDSIIEGLKKFLPIERVITTTSREPRPGESQGSPYYFIPKAEFEEGIHNNLFLEYAKEYNDQYYGVTFDEIERVKQSGKIGIWKIEYKGVHCAKKIFKDIIAVLITAPLEDLEKRIRSRSDVTDEFVKERMNYTRQWLEHKDIYDYVVVNEENKLDKAINEVLGIIKKLI